MKKVEETNNSAGTKCKTCHMAFVSKNQLFDHLEETGHAAFKD
jgi:hypothetical protein